MFRKIIKKILPGYIFLVLKEGITKIIEIPLKWKLAHLRWQMRSLPRPTDKVVSCLHYTVRINDGPNFYILYKDIFIKKIYHFESVNSNPLIIDCGSNIGISILYFKYIYPQARIIAFEPDPVLFTLLEENIKVNKLEDVKLIPAALAGKKEKLDFYSDGRYASCLAKYFFNIPKGWQKYRVSCLRLRDYLKEPIDFLKINIEGAEYEVLADSEEYLKNIKEMVIEYHHSPHLPVTLHQILDLLHRHGFRYLINDFDSETNVGVQPPFCLNEQSKYCLLIYAKRMD